MAPTKLLGVKIVPLRTLLLKKNDPTVMVNVDGIFLGENAVPRRHLSVVASTPRTGVKIVPVSLTTLMLPRNEPSAMVIVDGIFLRVNARPRRHLSVVAATRRTGVKIVPPTASREVHVNPTVMVIVYGLVD